MSAVVFGFRWLAGGLLEPSWRLICSVAVGMVAYAALLPIVSREACFEMVAIVRRTFAPSTTGGTEGSA